MSSRQVKNSGERKKYRSYRKIPKISPGAYIFWRPFLRGLVLEGHIFGGTYVRREIWWNFDENIPSNGTGIFTANRNGIELCHLQNTDKVFAFCREEAWHGTGIQSTQFGRSGNQCFGKNHHFPFTLNSYRNQESIITGLSIQKVLN